MKTQPSESSLEVERPSLSPSYPEIRAAGKDLFGKIMEATTHLDFDIIKAAKKMTLPTSERTLIFDSETDQNALLDFYVGEYRRGGKTKVEACEPKASNFSPLQAEQFRALRESRTSLSSKPIRSLPPDTKLYCGIYWSRSGRIFHSRTSA